MKRLLLVLFFTGVMVSPVNAQSTLALKEKCAEGAKKYYREAIEPFVKPNDDVGIEYHYNKKLDRCFLRVYHYGENYVEEIDDVYENKLIAVFIKSQGIWNVEGKISVFDKTKHLDELKKFNALIKPYMEE